MNTLMMTLQQPLTMATLARCLGLGPSPKASRLRAAQRRRQRSQLAALGINTDDPAPQVDDPDEDSDAQGCCGWFDSSHELHQGLVVLEHSGADGLGAELPVTVWLSLVLDGAPGTPAAAPTPDLTLRA